MKGQMDKNADFAQSPLVIFTNGMNNFEHNYVYKCYLWYTF